MSCGGCSCVLFTAACDCCLLFAVVCCLLFVAVVVVCWLLFVVCCVLLSFLVLLGVV